MTEIYDIEVFPNFFCYTSYCVEEKKFYTFEISERKNQWSELKDRLKQNLLMVGFNNVNYDWPVLETMLRTGKTNNFELFKLSSEIIDRTFTKKTAKNQIDLNLINHFDNPAKMTSLKDIEFMLGMENLQTLPYKFDEFLTSEMMDNVIVYNINDVKATVLFYQKCYDKIKFRLEMSRKFNMDFKNDNDVKMGMKIIQKYISNHTGWDWKDISNMGTKRSSVKLGECILPEIEFGSPQLSAVISEFRNTDLNTMADKISFSRSVNYKGFLYDFGLGGIHGCIKPGVYVSDEKHVIMSADVTSYYTNISIRNRFAPEHLGDVFLNVYEMIYNRRAEIKHKEPLESLALKNALNGCFGKSGEESSFMYDFKFLYSITLNGQFLLASLSEKLQDEGFQPLMINTDGLEFRIPRDKKQVFMDICSEWTAKTRMPLEYSTYEKMVIRDVNNYMALTTDEKVKYKGVFEIKKDFHKDQSMLIVPIMLKKYFIDGLDLAQIRKHENVNDFAIRVKSNSGLKINFHKLDNDKEVVQRLQKVNRIFASRHADSGYLYKMGSTGESTAVLSKQKVIVRNKLGDKQEILDNMDYEFYIRECKKIIDTIEDKQLSLF